MGALWRIRSSTLDFNLGKQLNLDHLDTGSEPPTYFLFMRLAVPTGPLTVDSAHRESNTPPFVSRTSFKESCFQSRWKMVNILE